MNTRQLVIGSLMVIISVVFAGCGGGGSGTREFGAADSLPEHATAGRATLNGTVYVPQTASANRTSGRTGFANSNSEPLPNAQVVVKRLRQDGSFESIGSQFSTVTDSSGKFSIPYVPMEENIIIEASKSAGAERTELKKVLSITEYDTSIGKIDNLSIDVGTTMNVRFMKDVLISANSSLADNAKLNGADLPREIIAESESIIQDSLQTDQAGAAPSVNLSEALGGDTKAGLQLDNLLNSENGNDLQSVKEKAINKGSLRVHVVALQGGGPLQDASVIITTNDLMTTKTTDTKGNAFFDDIPPGSLVDIEVKKDGFVMKKTSQNIEVAARLYNVTVMMIVSESNQQPIAKAGPDQNAVQGSVITLDGSNSYDPDGDALTYSWTQISGTATTLSSTTASQTTFTAQISGTFVFQIQVNDGQLSSEPDAVTVTISAVACFADVDCDDNNSLTIDSCSNPGVETAQCVNTAIACNADNDCNDENINTHDVCQNPGTIDSQCTNNNIACHSDSDCDDSNSLTVDVCANMGEESSTCENTPIQCVADSDCDDGNPLTLDACQNGGTLSASCSNSSFDCISDADCNDNNADTEDVCTNGGTTAASCNNLPIACHADLDCNDGNPLTIDSCTNASTASAACSNILIACNSNADCDDSNPGTEDICQDPGTTNSSCSNLNISCFSDSDCNDSISSTIDTCNNPGTSLSACNYINITCSSNSDCSATEPFCQNAGTSNSVCTKSNEWVTIPAGDFIMGCATLDTNCSTYYTPEHEKPKHVVTVPEYQILKYEVTNYQYKQCVIAGQCTAPQNNSSVTRPSYYDSMDYDNYPVIYVSWNQAKTYCQWIGGKLPTAAEWEKAARGPYPSESIFPWGNANPSCTKANISIGGVFCTGDTMLGGSLPDGISYYGIHNLADNVREWVEDAAHDSYVGAPTDGSAWGSGNSTGFATIRGAGWRYAADVTNDRWESRNSWIGRASDIDLGWDFGGIRCTK